MKGFFVSTLGEIRPVVGLTQPDAAGWVEFHFVDNPEPTQRAAMKGNTASLHTTPKGARRAAMIRVRSYIRQSESELVGLREKLAVLKKWWA